MGFDDSPDSLALGVVQALRGEAEACGHLLLAANPLLELLVGFHSSGLNHEPGGCPVNWTAHGGFLFRCDLTFSQRPPAAGAGRTHETWVMNRLSDAKQTADVVANRGVGCAG